MSTARLGLTRRHSDQQGTRHEACDEAGVACGAWCGGVVRGDAEAAVGGGLGGAGEAEGEVGPPGGAVRGDDEGAGGGGEVRSEYE